MTSRLGIAAAALAAAVSVAMWPGAALATERIEFAVLMTALDQISIREHGFVTKWTRKTPLTVKVEFPLNEAGEKVLAYTLATITANTAIAFQRNDAEEKPDISLAYEVGQMFMGATPAGGITRSTWGKYNGELRLGAIRLRKSNEPYHLNRLVPHEMMHAIGFLDHSQGFDSISSYYATRLSFSDWDTLFMRVLYDSRLTAGMPRVFALPVMCRLLHEKLVADNNTLVTDLVRGGPQPYCEELARQPVVARKPLDEVRFGWAYLVGNGVQRDLAEADKRANAGLAKNEADARPLLDAIAKAKAAVETAAARARPEAKYAALETADFRPPPVGTTFLLGAKRQSYLRIERIEGTTIHTVNADNAPFRWAAMFFGRAPRLRVDPAEDTAASIWPLAVGKSVAFEHGGAFRNVVKVLRTESVPFDGRQIPTFVVERRVTRIDDADSPPYEGVFTFWYAPELGFPAKYQTRFTGKTNEKPTSWTVSEVRPPVLE